MANKTDYAYIAGIIDGDGCIRIHPQNNGHNWALKVLVDMQSKKIIDMLVGIFGGSYNLVKKKDSKFVIYYWNILGRKAFEMLKKIKPYLTEKKAQADVAINFYIHQRNYFRKRYTNHCNILTEQEIKKREEYKNRLTKLKTAFLTPVAPAETERENVNNDEATVHAN